MDDIEDITDPQEGPWHSMVRLSAAIVQRDYGRRAYEEALKRVENYVLEDNDCAVQFWNDVAKSIKICRTKKYSAMTRNNAILN